MKSALRSPQGAFVGPKAFEAEIAAKEAKFIGDEITANIEFDIWRAVSRPVVSKADAGLGRGGNGNRATVLRHQNDCGVPGVKY